MPSGAGRCRKALDQFLAKIDGELVDPEARAIVRVLADELDALADRLELVVAGIRVAGIADELERSGGVVDETGGQWPIRRGVDGT